MTRSIQKESEHEALMKLLADIGIKPDSDPTPGETPDFLLSLRGRLVGVELTKYQSGKVVAAVSQRAIEAAWEEFEKSASSFRLTHADINDFNVHFSFKDRVPSRKEHIAFLQEFSLFVSARQDAIGSEFVEYWIPDFSSMLMQQYLKALVVRRHASGEWDSNLTGGFVDRPATRIATIVKEKTTKGYRVTDELWLAIQYSHRPSEMVLPVTGPSELDACPDLQRNLSSSPFSRVYVCSAMGVFQWFRKSGRWGRTSIGSAA
jgi:hypothetical protein